MPAISFPPVAMPFVLVGLAALPVLAPVPVAAALLVVTCCVWPREGSATFPSTSHPPGVELGQAGGVRLGEYAELGVPVGVKVAHWACKLEKSGETGVGVPVLEKPSWMPEATTVAETSGP